MVSIKMCWADSADEQLGLPRYETAGAAGADLRANFPDRGAYILKPGERRAIPTGLCCEIPSGFEIQVRPRSGLALRHGVTMLNAPGTIDSDYRGEIAALIVNLGDVDFTISHGDRIAQMVVAPVVQADFEIVDTLNETERGTGGFGSTGVSERKG